jgi:hypothetical protein
VRRRQAYFRKCVRPPENRTHFEIDIQLFEGNNRSAASVKERKIPDGDRKRERIDAQIADFNRATRLFGERLDDFWPDDRRNDKKSGNRVECQESGGDKYEFYSPDV